MSFPTGLLTRPLEFAETFADDFNRANDAGVGNGWTDPQGAGGPWEINSNRLMRNDAVGTVNNQNSIFIAGNIVDQYAECVPLSHNIGPIVRLAGPPGGYIAFADATKVYCEKSSLGGYTAMVGGEAAVALDFATDVLRIEARDTSIKVFVNGAEIISVTDSTWLQGHRGVAVRSATGDLLVDNFACGE